MPERKRYVRKNQELFTLLDTIKLWPSRSGALHGIRSIERNGDLAMITTHCGKRFAARNSRTSRAARWLRGRLHSGVCAECGIPDWKIEKYAKTTFTG